MPSAWQLPAATTPLGSIAPEAIWADQLQDDGTIKTVKITPSQLGGGGSGTIGPTGPIGPIGPTGATGTGTIGPTGPTGASGFIGSEIDLTPSGGFGVINVPDGTLLLKAGSAGSNGLVLALSPIETPGISFFGTTFAANGIPIGISQNVTATGTVTSGNECYVNLLQAASDDVSSPESLTVLGVNHFFGGPSMLGNRNTIDVISGYTTTSGNSGPGGVSFGTAFSGMRLTAVGACSDGGTADNPLGAAFALNNVVQLTSAATNWSGCCGQEIDIGCETGSSVVDKMGMQIVLLSTDGVSGSRDDVCLSFNNQLAQSATAGWKYGLAFGRQGGHFPIRTTGTLIGSIQGVGDSAITVGSGIDFSNITITNYSLKMPNFTVDGAGNTITASLRVGTGAAESTTATTGHLMIPYCAGPPTGIPANASTGISLRYDTTNHKLWAFDNATNTWKGVALS